jgi:alpha-maltose-1-phosphate synthase
MLQKVAFIAEGDADTADCWSGSGRKFVQALRAIGLVVDVYDAALRSWPRAVAAMLSYHPMRARWRQRYGLGAIPFFAKSMRAGRALNAHAAPYDAVIQIGATFSLSRARRPNVPYVLYCDSNIAHSRRGAPYSAASRLSEREFAAAMQREKSIYDSADRIWTMSDALAESFRQDFEQPSDKIRTIYAGMNNPPREVTAAHRLPRILFVGKDHERKGSTVLLQAFEIVRGAIPEAELHMVGRSPAATDPFGVVSYGVVSRETQAGSALLDALFATSAVFCMPSRYEPFGIAFVEAMSAGLPCVGTTQWAMPEIIEHGETGYLVADGSVDELATALIAILRDPINAAGMGARGRERALSRFTWDRVAASAVTDLNDLTEVGISKHEMTFSV